MIPRALRSTLFPYTTLFRSIASDGHACAQEGVMSPSCTLRSSRRARRTATCRTATSRLLARSEEHTSELQSHSDLVCRLLLEKKKQKRTTRKLKTPPKMNYE